MKVVSESEVTIKEYRLRVISVPGNRLYFQRWDDVLAINHNPATNGGYTVTAVRWYRNEAQISTDKYIRYEGGGIYRAEVEIDGLWHSLCPFVSTRAAQGVTASPNPVSRGESLTLHLTEGFVGGTLSIYSIAGTLVKANIVLPTMHTSVNLTELATGIYLFKVTATNGNSETVKIIVE